MEEVFSELPSKCAAIGNPIPGQASHYDFFGYATGSSSFHNWVARSGTNKNHLCGSTNHSVVIANGQKVKGNFPKLEPQLCRSGTSVLERALDLQPNPKLIVIQFMGNSAYRSVRQGGRRVVPSSRWGYELPRGFENTQFDLSKDITQFLDQLPDDVPCLVMTTTPNKLKNSVRKQRRHAQAVIARDVSNRCGFVAGVTPTTVRAFDRNSSFHGDKFHVSTQGSLWFFDHHLESMCSQIRKGIQLAQ